MKIIWIFLGVSQNWTSFWWSFLFLLASFLKVKIQYGNIFWGLLNFQTFLGPCPTLLIFFGVAVDAGSNPTHKK